MPRLFALTACAIACAPGISGAVGEHAAALAQPDPGLGLAMCREIGHPPLRDECVATMVQRDGALGGRACPLVDDPMWAGECWFSAAEYRAQQGERWAALAACGDAGPFYDECLYHLWTIELKASVAASSDLSTALAGAGPVLEFWGGIQTVANDPKAQIEGDFWAIAWAHHGPVDLLACDRLPTQADQQRCQKHTPGVVARALVGLLLQPGLDPAIVDRSCRRKALPEQWRVQLYVPHPTLEAEAQRAAEAACALNEGQSVRRWNPIFSARHRPGTVQ